MEKRGKAKAEERTKHTGDTGLMWGETMPKTMQSPSTLITSFPIHPVSPGTHTRLLPRSRSRSLQTSLRAPRAPRG